MSLKNQIKVRVLILVVLSFVSQGSWSSETNSMQKVFVNQCDETKSRCLRVESDKVSVSRAKHLYFFKNPTIHWTNSGKTLNLKPQAAYMDMSENRIVLLEKNKNGSATETSFDLTTLHEKKLVIR
jgi:predicted metalloprotease